MHTYLAEIMAKTRLEESPCGLGERLATGLSAVNGACWLRVNPGSGYAHDPFCYLVGLLLIRIPRLANGQFCLHPGWRGIPATVRGPKNRPGPCVQPPVCFPHTGIGMDPDPAEVMAPARLRKRIVE